VNERGAGSVLAIGAMAVVTFVAAAVLMVAQIVIARATATAAADAAALAAAPMTFPPVAGGRSPIDAASTLAEVNGARLVSCACLLVGNLEPRHVQVTVAVSVDLPILGERWVHASSAAEFVP
jgi:secretion/DNA translocation related TadE-like protein